MYEDANINIKSNVVLGLVEPDNGKVIIENNGRIDFLTQVIDDNEKIKNMSVFNYLLSARSIEELNDALQMNYNEISINKDGDLYPCEYLKSSISYGNIKNISISEVFNTLEYNQHKDMILTIAEECKKCDFFEVCGNGCPSTRIKNGKIKYDGKYVYCKARQMLFNEIDNVLKSNEVN